MSQSVLPGLSTKKWIASSAVVSSCGNYRYELTRTLATGAGTVLFIMLNPSKADGKDDDATLRRCIGYATKWGYRALVVCNLFAYRATDPRDLRKALALGVDVVGPENDAFLKKHVSGDATAIVCAWGPGGEIEGRDNVVRKMVCDLGKQSYVLQFGVGGHPLHPLRLSKELLPIRWNHG